MDDLKVLLRYHKETRGCIFDRSDWKYHRKVVISSPNICNKCKEIAIILDQIISEKFKKHLLLQGILKVLDKGWLENPMERNSIIFNLKKDFKYNIDRNSGLYKTNTEKLFDSTMDKLPRWIIGTIITGIIGGLLLLLGIRK